MALQIAMLLLAREQLDLIEADVYFLYEGPARSSFVLTSSYTKTDIRLERPNLQKK